jgi:hypothetical protein
VPTAVAVGRPPEQRAPVGAANPWSALADAPRESPPVPRTAPRSVPASSGPRGFSGASDQVSLPRWKVVLLVVLGSLITQEIAAWLERRMRS